MLKVYVTPEYIGQFSSLVMIEEETDRHHPIVCIRITVDY